jgi:hypothetical protein
VTKYETSLQFLHPNRFFSLMAQPLTKAKVVIFNAYYAITVGTEIPEKGVGLSKKSLAKKGSFG